VRHPISSGDSRPTWAGKKISLLNSAFVAPRPYLAACKYLVIGTGAGGPYTRNRQAGPDLRRILEATGALPPPPPHGTKDAAEWIRWNSCDAGYATPPPAFRSPPEFPRSNTMCLVRVPDLGHHGDDEKEGKAPVDMARALLPIKPTPRWEAASVEAAPPPPAAKGRQTKAGSEEGKPAKSDETKSSSNPSRGLMGIVGRYLIHLRDSSRCHV